MTGSLEVIVLAAGKGTRMNSRRPKVLHEVCGRSLLERVLRAAAELQPNRIVVTAGYGEAEVRQELGRLSQESFLKEIEIDVAVQAEQKGTGHAAEVGLSKVSAEAEKVLILAGDSPLLKGSDLKPLISSASNSLLTFLTCIHPSPAGFGRIIRDSSGAVKAIVEHKDCDPKQLEINEINTSIYLADRNFLTEALSTLEARNAQGELYLTDIVGYGVKQGASVTTVSTTELAPVLGANTRYELAELERMRRLEINRAWMEAGVSMEDPLATYIDEEVQIGTDTYLGAGTRLLGKTVIESDVRIEGQSVIIDSHVGAETYIKLSCRIEDAKVGARGEIGPFANLRPGSILKERVKIGNFVETKKAELQAGVKANHLTYLGDAVVGEETNIGAGTITCNYDGMRKHVTSIGAGCFIGSNSALVAPLEIGDGAYVGAGSTITQNIPSEALGVARSSQRVIEGWAKRKKHAAKASEGK